MGNYACLGGRHRPSSANDRNNVRPHRALHGNTHTQDQDAKQELKTIVMRGTENVSEYYSRNFPLWQKAKTPQDERIYKFMTTVKLAVANALVGRRFADVYALLDEAKIIEKQKDIGRSHPRQEKFSSKNAISYTSSTKTAEKEPATPSRRSITSTTVSKAIPAAIGADPNAALKPTARKPSGWIGAWHNRETSPKKLEGRDRETLMDQGSLLVL